ncbi:MAG: AAA family ATPase [Prevotellaceae bacterium]|nr:AAA family ATPase [Prevotellaceae bacterium]
MITKIKSVFVRKLWDYKDIKCNFNEDINILIGSNGTSKTTFLTIIEALLNVELPSIEDVEFEKVFIEIESEGNLHTIEVERLLADSITPIFRYHIDNDEIIEISMSDFRVPYSRMRMSARSAYSYLREKMHEIISISWLSITRSSENEERRPDESDVDQKLRHLMRLVVSYKLQLETRINDRAKKFNEDIVSLLLYNSEYDSLPNNEEIQQLMNITDEELRTSLHQVFSFFGDARTHSVDIEKHVESIRNLKSIFTTQKSLNATELLPLALLKRTFKMQSLTSDYQNDRALINEPIKNYTDIVSVFIKDKSIEFNESGEPMIFLKKQGQKERRRLSMSSLSSGEKQLMILLTETLLQQKQPFVFIADEPELSLHIEWQRNLISSIRKLNPNAQIIFATHAPEIAGNYSTRLINMENVTIYG